MRLLWYGDNCFKIQTKTQRGEKEITILMDPFSREIGLRPPQGQADIITLSSIELLTKKLKALGDKTFLIDSAGEYSIKGVAITGIESFQDKEKGELRGRNTIFTIESEGIRVCHMGNIGHSLTEEEIDEIGDVDILLIPVGNKDSLSLKELKVMVGQLEPGIIIPMGYKLKGLKKKVNDCVDFCKEFGVSGRKKEDKLTVKAKDLKEKENNLVILKAV